jgi:hypothetical protein
MTTVQKGNIEHISNDERISITADSNNIIEYSRIYRISSSTPGKDIVYPFSDHVGDITCTLDTDYSSNSRTGAIVINFINPVTDFTPNSRIAYLIVSNNFVTKPKVYLTMYSAPAEITAGEYPFYWVETFVNGFNINASTLPASGQSIKLFYVFEE